MGDAWLWLSFFLIGMTTMVTRGSFILLGERARLPPAMQRVLRYAPAAALSGLVMPDILLDGGELSFANPKVAAALVVVVLVTRSRNPWLPFIGGMAVLLVLRRGFGF